MGIYFRAIPIPGRRDAIAISGLKLVSEVIATETADVSSTSSTTDALNESDESYLVNIGDYVVGVAGVPTYDMTPAILSRVIDAIRPTTKSGLQIILHLSTTPIIEEHIMGEAAMQMAIAAQQLMMEEGDGEESNNEKHEHVLRAIKGVLDTPDSF